MACYYSPIHPNFIYKDRHVLIGQGLDQFDHFAVCHYKFPITDPYKGTHTHETISSFVSLHVMWNKNECINS